MTKNPSFIRLSLQQLLDTSHRLREASRRLRNDNRARRVAIRRLFTAVSTNGRSLDAS